MALPICKNCKYFKPESFEFNNIQKGICKHPNSQSVNIITGVVSYQKATEMRNDSSFIVKKEVLCGQKGTLYEQENNH